MVGAGNGKVFKVEGVVRSFDRVIGFGIIELEVNNVLVVVG